MSVPAIGTRKIFSGHCFSTCVAKFPKDIYEQYYDAFEAGDAALMESSGKQLENTIKKRTNHEYNV